MKKQLDITLVKAIGIILVVMAHSCCTGYLSSFSYMLCVSTFFISTGYCFNTKYLSDGFTYIKNRFKGIYLPFWKWSVFFLVLNPLWYATGILSEQYGNQAGGVQHPLDFHQMCQHLWSITFNMTGYDQFLGGAYWFFRSLFVASMLWFLLFYLFNHFSALSGKHARVGTLIAAAAFGMCMWHVGDGMIMTSLGMGTYRELMGLFFIASGFLLKQINTWRTSICATKEAAAWKRHLAKCISNRLLVFAVSATIVTVILILCPVNMAFKQTAIHKIPVFAVAGTVGYVMLLVIAKGMATIYDRGMVGQRLVRIFTYVGNNTLYIFGFHFFAFKLVSAIKVLCYGLEWQQIGSHPVVHDGNGEWWWLLYTVVGVTVPLLCIWSWRKLTTMLHQRRQ